MALYKNKYRIEPSRLKNWDYGNAGAYFITICTHDRNHYFGTIENDKMILNETGSIVETEWLKTPGLRYDMNLSLDEFVVMPNHFHGIILIGDNEYNSGDRTGDGGDGRDAMHRVSAGENGNKFGPQSKNLASIIRGFKSSVTTQARMIHPAFTWQSRYHDHIIRNHTSFVRIQNYVINNEKNWKEDKFYQST